MVPEAVTFPDRSYDMQPSQGPLSQSVASYIGAKRHQNSGIGKAKCSLVGLPACGMIVGHE